MWGVVTIIALSMSLTSCDDILGHWEKPAPVPVTPPSPTPTPTPTPAVFASDEYNEASWNPTLEKVEFTQKTAASTPTAVADANAGGTRGTWYKWYIRKIEKGGEGEI